MDLPNNPIHFYYDNACHLAQYIMVREPALTERIRFMIDRFSSSGSCRMLLCIRHG